MLCRKLLNCTIPDAAVQANADIVGYGVVAAFILSAVLTVLAVLCAYLSDSVPEVYLTETDRIFISDFQELIARLSRTRLIKFTIACWSRLKTLLHRHDAPKGTQKLTRKQREEAFIRFILALSDQQLAVGLSILVASVANQCTLLLSEFRVAFALAWFSATTHLATLDSLRQYFLQHKTLRNLRLFGMVVFMVLFLICFVLILLTDGASIDDIPLHCYLSQHNKLPEGLALKNFSAFKYQPVYASGWVIICLFLLCSYHDKILQVYRFNALVSYGERFYSVKFKISLNRWLGTAPIALTAATSEEWKQVLDEAGAEKWSKHFTETLNRQSQSSLKSIERLKIQFQLARLLYCRSMLPVASSLTFMLTYGLTQIVFFRWLQFYLKDPRDMEFGQITPLFLLILPVIAAAEIYYDASNQWASMKPYHDKSFTTEFTHNSVVIETVTRSNTLDFTSSDDMTNLELLDMEETARKYDRNLAVVKKYFYREFKEIDRHRADAIDEDQCRIVLQRKTNIWKECEKLSEIERSLHLACFVKVRLYSSCFLSVITAVFLNYPGNDYFDMVAVIILYAQFMIGLVGWIRDWLQGDLLTYTRLLLDVQEKAREIT